MDCKEIRRHLYRGKHVWNGGLEYPSGGICMYYYYYTLYFICVVPSPSTAVHPVLGSERLRFINKKYFWYLLCYNQSQICISKGIIVFIPSLNNLFFSWRQVSYFEVLIFKTNIFLCWGCYLLTKTGIQLNWSSYFTSVWDVSTHKMRLIIPASFMQRWGKLY